MQENKRLYQFAALIFSFVVYFFPIPVGIDGQPYQFLYYFAININFLSASGLPKIGGIFVIQFLLGRKMFIIFSRPDTIIEKLIQVFLTVCVFFVAVGFVVYLADFLINMFKNI